MKYWSILLVCLLAVGCNSESTSDSVQSQSESRATPGDEQAMRWTRIESAGKGITIIKLLANDSESFLIVPITDRVMPTSVAQQLGIRFDSLQDLLKSLEARLAKLNYVDARPDVFSEDEGKFIPLTDNERKAIHRYLEEE